MSEQLTHWKKLRNPDYLGSWDLPNGQDIVLTIKSVATKMVHDGNGGQSECMVMAFAERVKPMIVNATNAKTIQKLTKTPFVEQWAGKQIQIGISKVKAFGEVHDALRVRQTAPMIQQQPAAQQIDPNEAAMAKVNIEGASTLDELRNIYTGLDKPIALLPEIVAAKDKRKAELEGGVA